LVCSTGSRCSIRPVSQSRRAFDSILRSCLSRSLVFRGAIFVP